MMELEYMYAWGAYAFMDCEFDSRYGHKIEKNENKYTIFYVCSGDGRRPVCACICRPTGISTTKLSFYYTFYFNIKSWAYLKT